jgi:uncharacterized Rmd1/YagE family protein
MSDAASSWRLKVLEWVVIALMATEIVLSLVGRR